MAYDLQHRDERIHQMLMGAKDITQKTTSICKSIKAWRQEVECVRSRHQIKIERTDEWICEW